MFLARVYKYIYHPHNAFSLCTFTIRTLKILFSNFLYFPVFLFNVMSLNEEGHLLQNIYLNEEKICTIIPSSSYLFYKNIHHCKSFESTYYTKYKANVTLKVLTEVGSQSLNRKSCFNSY